MSDFDSMFGDALSADDINAAVDGDTDAGTPEPNPSEMEQAAAEYAAEALAALREQLVEEMPALEPLVEFLNGPDEDAIRKLAMDVNARLGGQAPGNHPGRPDEYASLEGDDAYNKARSLAKQGTIGPLMRLKESAALSEAGIVGSRMDAEQRATIKEALAFSRRVGDHDAVRRLTAQLG
jgi:hypothetical protein